MSHTNVSMFTVSRVGAMATALATMLLGCASPDDDVQRGAAAGGKADFASGTCMADEAPLCDGPGEGGCFCDQACLSYGDCCFDYADACGLPVTPALSLTFRSPQDAASATDALGQQLAALRDALAIPEAAAFTASLREELLDRGRALQVLALGTTRAGRDERGHTVLSLDSYAPGTPNQPEGVLVIDPRAEPPEVMLYTAEAADDHALDAVIELIDPVSFNVIEQSLADQHRVIERALATPRARAVVDHLRSAAQAAGEALMVTGIGAPQPGSTCRDLRCRDTFVALGAYAPGADTRPLGILWIRDFAAPDAVDSVLFTSEP